MMAGAANFFAKSKKRVSFIKVPLFIQDIKQSMYDNEYRQDMIGHLRFSEVLVLDDIGSEAITPWTRDEILFPILDYRMNHELKTYFTSNYTLEELEQHYCLRDKENGYVASLPIGSLNMFNKYVKAILPKAKEVKLMKERVMKELKDAEKDKGTFRCRYLAVTGGSMRALRSVLVSLKWIAKDCYEFDSNLLKELTKYLLEDEERCAHLFLKVKPDRIHTLFCGLVIIDTIAQYTQAEKIQVSMNGVREGYLIERVIGEQNAKKISVYTKS